ncbi:hypothetical protein P0136_02520 [Lentisphaerota bacterium ZTH]|nr:hypothetical protein JYG24_06340 [Lentisphaerota bacterium]WET06876.1 hypothetical protein P0136_02520 [Lentisphaerota bacterium ZTH]
MNWIERVFWLLLAAILAYFAYRGKKFAVKGNQEAKQENQHEKKFLELKQQMPQIIAELSSAVSKHPTAHAIEIEKESCNGMFVLTDKTKEHISLHSDKPTYLVQYNIRPKLTYLHASGYLKAVPPEEQHTHGENAPDYIIQPHFAELLRNQELNRPV